MKRKSTSFRKETSKVLTVKNENRNINGNQEHFPDPITLRVMKEMDVQPLDAVSFLENNDIDMPSSYINKHMQLVTGQHRNHNENKISSDDFVLFRGHGVTQPLGEDHFSKLSDEIILHVFKLLPKSTLVKCSGVCKRWRNLSYDESLWRHYDFGRRIVKPCVLETLLKRGPYVLRLAISEIQSPVFTKEFLAMPDWPQTLKYLDLSVAEVSPGGLAEILFVCNNLSKLSLERCALNDNCCSAIAQSKNLTILNMAMCTKITAAGILNIASNCQKLVEWNLAWTNLDSTSLHKLSLAIPSSLRRLNISGYRESLTDEYLIRILKRCPDLIELDISDCVLLTHASFEVLVTTCVDLEHLHTSRSYSIPTSSNRLLRNMKNFKNLEIFKTLTDEAFAALCDYMPEIKLNKNMFSKIARPTPIHSSRSSVWAVRIKK